MFTIQNCGIVINGDDKKEEEELSFNGVYGLNSEKVIMVIIFETLLYYQQVILSQLWLFTSDFMSKQSLNGAS